MKRIILGLSFMAAVATIVIGATTAFLSDTETSQGNVFAAGQIDLGIDNQSYYNGILNPGTSWSLDFDLDDLDTPRLFFNFLDMKPDDEGEDTISVHVKDNDAWACMAIDLTSRDDNGLTEPEQKDGDTTGGPNEGELQDEINFIWWADDGDNVLEDDELDNIFRTSSLDDLDGFKVALADASGQGILSSGPLVGSETYYIGKAWCYGALTLDPVPAGQGVDPTVFSGVVCDGTSLNNVTQTDSVKGDISFLAVQARHDERFLCENGTPGCASKPDVMLVLDRSGSIDAGELATLKDAANAFVTALAPSTDGAHMGQTSFATTGSLDQPLTESAAAMTAAINGLVSGGLTNLFEGIDLATDELTGPNDRNDATSPDFMVIITDGNPNEPGSNANAEAVATAAADAARLAGIEVYVVGVGSDVDATYLINNIADDPTHFFSAADFADLAAVLQAIANCEDPPEITGTITVDKVIVNDDSGGADEGDFQLFVNGFAVVDNVPTAFLADPAGTLYTVTETGPGGYSATFSGACNASGEITLTPGDAFTCTITNNDTAQQSLTGFPDGFGSGASVNDIPNWDEQGNDNDATTLAQNATSTGENTASPDGDRFALVGDNEWFCRAVDTTGFSNLMLSYYWRGDVDAEDGDSGFVEHRTGGGNCGNGTWTQEATHELDDTNNNVDEGWSSLQSLNIPDGTTFIRFRNGNQDAANESFRIDGVNLSGTP